MNILFFARKNDEISGKCLSHLVELGFEVDTILSCKRGEILPNEFELSTYDYIFCFRSYFILPKSLLDKTKYYNINFHPGPPKYPGSGGVNLALFNEDTEFGVTAHLMDESVDTGHIIECRKFKVHESDNLEILFQGIL